MLQAQGWEEGGVPAVRSKGVLGPESLLRHTIVLGRRVQAVQAH